MISAACFRCGRGVASGRGGSTKKAPASFEHGPIVSRKMIFRFVNYPILCLNLGFEISDICRKAIQRRSAHTPRAVFALEGPNRKVWIYVAHEPSMRSLGQTASGDRAASKADIEVRPPDVRFTP